MSLTTELIIPNLHYGVSVQYMLTRMTDAELEHVRDLSNEMFGSQAAVFCE